MPEGPEVRKTVDKLQRYKNSVIKKISINSGRYLKKDFAGFNLFKKDLPLRITEISCKGKFIYWKFENGKVLFNTLGMSGYWTKDDMKHNNVSFYLDNDIVLNFNDYRNFGNIMYKTEKDLERKLNELGVDILQDFKNYDEFRRRIERKRDDALIGTTLLDQKVACGCGNYLRAEVLYHCKISPYRELKDLSEKEIVDIWSKLAIIGWIFYSISKGIKKGVFKENNRLVKLYQRNGENNEYGYYTNFMVYFQDEDSKGNKVTSEKLGARTIHYVPTIQK